MDLYKPLFLIFVFSLAVIALMISNNHRANAKDESQDVLSGRIKNGEYLVKITGCNDCHSPGYIESQGKTPVEKWLTGTSLGWHGPWGTTYPINLRLLVDGIDEKQWLGLSRNVKSRPPMPWWALEDMTDEDLIDIYLFIKHLGPAGGPAPAYIPPDKKPNPPYVSFPSP